LGINPQTIVRKNCSFNPFISGVGGSVVSTTLFGNDYFGYEITIQLLQLDPALKTGNNLQKWQKKLVLHLKLFFTFFFQLIVEKNSFSH
jgi:hypothetical protein